MMNSIKYNFKAKNIPVVIKETIDAWEKQVGIFKSSLSLGVDYEYIERRDDKVIIRGYTYDYNKLKNMVREGVVYAIDKGKVYPISGYSQNFYYKLYPIAPDKAPTIEISGIKMHRVIDIDPWTDAKNKVRILKIKRGDKVLDICTGLGYTAIHAHRYTSNILSIELDRNVLDIATYNPWSRELEDIDIILGDAYDVIRGFEDSSFDVVIHDPPRFSRAGRLYSLDFYKELYRVMDKCGRLFHYTGKVGYKRRGINIMGDVAGRLKKVGFIVSIKKNLYGVYALKPCRKFF